MRQGQPSRTALGAASHRAAHQVLERGFIFADPLAIPNTEQLVFSTLGFIASLPGGAHVVFDYGNPPALGPVQDEYAAARETLAARVAAVGEPFRSHFETNVLHAKLATLGFREVEDLNPALIRERYFTKREVSSPNRGGHIVRAETV